LNNGIVNTSHLDQSSRKQVSLQISNNQLPEEVWYQISWTNQVGSNLSTVMPEEKVAMFVELFLFKNVRVKVKKL